MGAKELSPEATQSLLAIARSSKTHGLNFWLSPAGKLVVTLGEVHLKIKTAKSLGKAAVDAFDLRGVEGMSHWDRGLLATCARWLGFCLVLPQILIRKLSANQVKGSTILDAWAATHGKTLSLEDGFKPGVRTWWALVGLVSFLPVMLFAIWLLIHYPMPYWIEMATLGYEIYYVAGLIPALLLRQHSWAIVIHPLAGLIYERDQYMAKKTIEMPAGSDATSALTIMGRAHLKGFGRALGAAGFQRIERSEVLGE